VAAGWQFAALGRPDAAPVPAAAPAVPVAELQPVA
jgi:hypothetical protein